MQERLPFCEKKKSFCFCFPNLYFTLMIITVSKCMFYPFQQQNLKFLLFLISKFLNMILNEIFL